MAAVDTKAMWTERVRAWRASGQAADVFAHGRGFQGSTLRWWSSRLGPLPAPRFLQLVARSSPSTARPLVVAVGSARIEVAPGFDPQLLAAVVAALGATP